ncbi:protease complex subunit PrcB family protein [Chitinophaga sp. Mgbs1]|uniref:Protease complex subunit PrcB family protein n=1 Tax=Chitinophaga solisilvae TaxID=1233460 RepID=A0A433WGK1_9BACT|nr:protease complex subunit PrcB family protein [Chitinophaga solisilvae]
MKLSTVLTLPVFLLAVNAQPLFSMEKNVMTASTETIIELLEEQTPAAKGVTIGAGIDLIVKGLGLNIDNIRFIKAPKATDYYRNANDKAPYASSLIIAANNGIQLNPATRFDNAMTREQFALALYQAMTFKEQYPANMMWIIVKDEAKFSKDALNAVQMLVKFNVVKLENGSFRPKAPITSQEAATMIKKATAFIREAKEREQGSNPSAEEVTFTSTPVNNKVNSIVISRGSKPNAGYRIAVTGISFTDNKEAVIRYKLIDPAPGDMTAQVITEPKAETYVGKEFKVVLEKE